MWKAFSNGLRKTIVLALEEAARRGDPCAEVEHLLWALAQDRESISAQMLRYCGIDLNSVGTARHDIKTVGNAHPDKPTTPKWSAFRHPERYSVKDLAQTFKAGSFGSTLRMTDRHESHVLDSGRTTWSPRGLQLLSRTSALAEACGDKKVGVEHLLRALLESDDPMLRQLGLDRQRAMESLEHWIDAGPSRHRWGPRPRIPRSSLASSIVAPMAKLTRAGAMAYRVFVKMSLGHPRFARDPYPLYRKLRKTHPLRRDPIAPVWVALRYDDVVTVLRDQRFRKEPFLSDALSDAARAQFELPAKRDAAVEGEPLAMLFLDPPRHTRIRSLFNKAFIPRTLNALRPRIQQIADDLLDRVETRGEMDVIRDLAVPMPIRVIAELVGFPPEDYEQLKKWSDDFAAALTINPSAELQARSMQSREQMRGYFENIVSNLRQNPKENLICTLLEANKTGELLTPMELFANCTLLMAAGHETTTNLIGNGMLALLRNPDQLQLLRIAITREGEAPSEPPSRQKLGSGGASPSQSSASLISSAIDELLRYDSPVQWIARAAAEDLELRGQKIRRGEIVIGSLGAANRDPDMFDDPDRLDIRRKNNKHIAFGHGEHYCIGAMLARMEGEIAIGTLIRRFEKMQLKTKRVKWNRNIIFRGLRQLELKLPPSPSGRGQG